MAEELYGGISSFNWCTPLRCNSVFTCSAAGSAEEDGGGSFGYFPAAAKIFEFGNGEDSFDISPLFSSSDLMSSSADWSQTFLESSETNDFDAAGLLHERPAETLHDDSVKEMKEDQILTGSAMDDTYFLSPFHLPFNSSVFWNTAAPSSNPREKPNATASRDSVLPASKKIRIEPPSSFPTFKVRKEKLGDRITALQQLVSPFGKTDTASVLHEAIDCINFLHEQVSGLSNPYARNGHRKTKQEGLQEKDLRSRGLCLAPISSTLETACGELPPADFWTELWRKL